MIAQVAKNEYETTRMVIELEEIVHLCKCRNRMLCQIRQGPVDN